MLNGIKEWFGTSGKTSSKSGLSTDGTGIFVEVEELSSLSLLAQRKSRNKKFQARSRIGGQYQSPQKGRGLEYAETRAYEPGDDVRHIDWRVTARTERPHTKLFREERERPLIILLVLNRSMFFGTRQRLKSSQALRAAALAGWEALYRGDRVGSMCLGNGGQLEFKPKGSRKHFLQQLYQWSAFHNQLLEPLMGQNWSFHTTDLMHEGMERLVQAVSTGSYIRIVSDGSGLEEKARMHLNRLCLHNEVAFTLIHDPFEFELPVSGRFRVSDGEREAWLEGDTPKQREHFQIKSLEYHQGLETYLRNQQVAYERISTADDLSDWTSNNRGLRYQ